MFGWKQVPGFVHSILVPSLPKHAWPKAQDQVMPPQFHWLMPCLSQLSERGHSIHMQVRPYSAMMLRHSTILNPDAQGRSTGASKRDCPWRASSSGSLCSNTILHSHAIPPQFQQGHGKAEGCTDFIKSRPSLPRPEILTCSIWY